MALIKPEQLRSGSYSITGSFSGSFYGDGSNLNNLPIPSIDTGSLVTTSSFNNFTSSYYTDSSSFEGRVTDLENFSSSLDASFVSEVEFSSFTSSYNTGSFTGSFTGDLTGNANSATSASYALTASYAANVPLTSSYALNAESSSYAQTASYIENAQTASYVENAQTASYVETAQTASYYQETDPVFTAVSGTFTTTASFNSFTASYYIDSASIVNEFAGLAETDEQTIELDTLTNKIRLKETVAAPISGTRTFEGNIIVTGSLNVLDFITGSLNGTASWAENSITASYIENAQTASYVENAVSASYSSTSSYVENAQTASYVENAQTASYVTLAQTASYVENAQTASYVLQSVSSSFASTASYVNTLNQDVLITGSLTVLQGATIYGSSSFTYVTASQLAVSASFISVNVFEPAQRFGGLIVYDSGSSLATASLAWDSLHNHWVYQNVSGATYTGGMLLSGPRNTGSLGDEPTLTQWFIPRSDGGDHLDDSQIYSSGSIHIVTGSLTVTNGITGSLSGSALFATSASYTLTASYVENAQTASFVSGSIVAPGLPTQILYNSASIIAASSEFVLSGSSVGIGTSTPTSSMKLDVSGSARFTTAITIGQLGNNGEISLVRSSTGTVTAGIRASAGGVEIGANSYINSIILTNGATGMQFNTFTTGTSRAERMRITDGALGVGGNVLIGTTAETGHRLVVSGSSSSGSVNLDNTLYVSGSRVGIGKTILNSSLDISGSAIITGSLTVTDGITGSLFGTSSWANNATTASYVQTAQTASYVLNAISASYSTFAVSASYIDGGFY
jgi:hypothetical protein